MLNEKIQFSEVFKEGWKLTKDNLGFLCGYTALFLALALLIQYAPNNEKHPILYSILLLFVLGIPYIGLYRSAIMLINGAKPKFDQFYSNWKLLSPFLAAFILLFLMAMIIASIFALPAAWLASHYGLVNNTTNFTTQQIILMILLGLVVAIPAIWLMVRFALLPYYIVDNSSGPIDALKKSYKGSYGHAWLLLKIYLVAIALGIVDALTYGISKIITMPLMVVVFGIVYSKLTKSETANPDGQIG